jgi:hypothetical protein
MRVSSPPAGTISSASDVTDEPNQNSKPRCDSDEAEAPTDRELVRAHVVHMQRR